MTQSQTLPPEEEPRLFDLIAHFCAHLKLSSGASPSAAHTAQSYVDAMTVFQKFIKHAYCRKRGFSAPYPVSMLDNDVLLAYYDWLVKTSPSRKKVTSPQLPPAQPADSGPAAEALPPDFSPPAQKPVAPAHYAHATIQHYLAAVKRFLSWAVAQNYLTQFDYGKTVVRLNDGRGSAGRRAYPHRKIDPNFAAIVLYYDNLPLPADKSGAGGGNLADWQVRRRQIALLRNRAIVHVFYDTGLRVSELTGLNRDEIDRALKASPLPEDVALDVVGKGGKQRTVWITRDSLERLKAYLETRNDPANILFTGNKKNTPITRQMVWKIVTDGAKAAGVGDFTGPHAFRHWLARQLFDDEEDPVPIEDVQVLLGHASPTTTRVIYAPHSNKARLHKTLKKARKKPEDTIKP